MHMRRSLALVTGALLLTAPLSSCGFDLATNRVYTPAAGVNDRDTTVDVLNAVIVSAEEGSGTFVATFVNNDTSEPASVEAMQASGERQVTVEQFAPIEIDPVGMVNLAAEDQEGIAVEGDLAAGQMVPLTIQLSGGQLVDLHVPVVPNCGEFEGLDGVGGECEVAEPEGGSH